MAAGSLVVVVDVLVGAGGLLEVFDGLAGQIDLWGDVAGVGDLVEDGVVGEWQGTQGQALHIPEVVSDILKVAVVL